jgi:hypothetical protein
MFYTRSFEAQPNPALPGLRRFLRPSPELQVWVDRMTINDFSYFQIDQGVFKWGKLKRYD